MADKLKIPYKYGIQSEFSQFKLRNIFDRNIGTDDTIDVEALRGILNDFLGYLSDQYRQNWLEVERHANRNPSGTATARDFDATIDSAATSADTTLHIYPTFASLVANETWSDTYVFHIRMMNRPDNPVIETGTTSAPGPFVLEGDGFGHQGGTFALFQTDTTSGGRAIWDFQGAVITVTKPSTIRNITIARSLTGLQTECFTGNMLFESVEWIGNIGGTQHISRPCSGILYAINSAFIQPQFPSLTVLSDCHIGLADTNITLANGALYWDGGSIALVRAGSNTYTFASTTFIRAVRQGTWFDQLSGGTPTLNFNTSAAVALEMAQPIGNAVTLSIGGSVGYAWIRGHYESITVSNTASWRDVNATFNTTADITGPGRCSLTGAVSAAKAILRGSGINGDIALQNNAGTPSGTWLQLIGCDDSAIKASIVNTGALGTGIAYSIDSNSDRSILLVSGTSTWPAASTNSSTTTRVIDETGMSGGGASRFTVGPWYQENAAAAQTNVVLNLFDGGGATTRASRLAMRAGSITGIVVRSNAARTTDTLTVEALINGAGTGLTAVLDGTNTTVKATTQATGLDTYIAGAELGVRITTGATWAPATADIVIELECVE